MRFVCEYYVLECNVRVCVCGAVCMYDMCTLCVGVWGVCVV